MIAVLASGGEAPAAGRVSPTHTLPRDENRPEPQETPQGYANLFPGGGIPRAPAAGRKDPADDPDPRRPSGPLPPAGAVG